MVEYKESLEIKQLLAIGESCRAEFKRMLKEKDLKKDRREKLVTQIKYITSEGRGFFVVGVEDINGKAWDIYGLTREQLELSEKILKKLCEEANARIIETEIIETVKGYVGKYVLERIPLDEIKETIGINVVGRVNSGKSTLIGIFVKGMLDDGKGAARSFLLKHPQEIKKGQTADIHQAFIGFDKELRPVTFHNPLDQEEIARILDESVRIVIFHDAPGHSEYAKTMIRSVLGQDAQYGLVLVPAKDEYKLIMSERMKTGLSRLDDITREHLILLSTQELPFLVVISKIDLATPEELRVVREVVRETLKSIGKIPLWIRTLKDIEIVLREIGHRVIVPVYEISSVTGEGLPLLRETIARLPSRISNELLTKPALAYIDKVYRGIAGTNVVVTGTVVQGVFKPGQTVIVGPDDNGEFHQARVASIEVFKKRVERVKAGDAFGIDLKRIDPEIVRRGQVIADLDYPVNAVRVFEANIIVTKHPTRITVGYSPVLHAHTVSQTVVFDKIYGKDYLTVGDFAKVRLKFKFRPEMLKVGDKIVTREANTRTIGRIVNIIK